jgi:two-component system, chemotaxis family, response regulator Rcp1
MNREMEADFDILLVDDNPADTDLTAEVLERHGCRGRIHTAHDGVEAVEFLRGKGKYADAPPAQLVVLDLNMPRKDGRAVLAEVKHDPQLRKIPIIVFTTSQSPRDIASSYELGANCYVNKPGTLPEFVAAVSEFGNFWFRRAHLPRRNHEPYQ